MPAITKGEREKLLARKEQLEARIKAIDARENIRKRKEDTRIKIIHGSLAMEHAATNPDSEFASTMRGLLDRHVVRPADRVLLGLAEREVDDQRGGGEGAKSESA